MKKLIQVMFVSVFILKSIFPIGVEAEALDLTQSQGYKYYEWNNETVASGASLSVFFPYIHDFDAIDFNATASAGTISTANVSWKTFSGFEMSSETLTSGTPITQMDSPIVTISFTNNEASPVTITANIWAIRKGK